ncbi:MAG: 3-hydroxyacyl-CoA dehydrogenase family protein [Deltaproteobacteria bacterium]|nr:3-hydroxyacyl-CoA dehydrogenase family protein [Deltaproteobacteria bacterium]
MEIKKVFVVGSGLMGGGITQVCAQAGYNVVMRDLTDEILQKSLGAIKWSVGKLVEKGRVTGAVDEIMSRIRPTTRMDDGFEADLAVEAVFENVDIKREVFQELDRVCPKHAILSSNTSAIPISELSSVTDRPDKVVGTHFFSPVPMMRLLEVIRTISTSDDTFESIIRWGESLGKEVVRVNLDVAGFAMNRINIPSTIEAIRLVEKGIVSIEDIDKGMRLGFGRPMGPLETGDMAGLDVGLGAMTAVYNETRDPKYAPPELLMRKVRAGHLGRKTRIGWYIYDEQGNKTGVAPLPI